MEPNAAFQRTKEHCLMGIKGTVRRSTDGDFIHANVDIDLIIDEEPGPGSLEKPIELFRIMEHFCLGNIQCLHWAKINFFSDTNMFDFTKCFQK